MKRVGLFFGLLMTSVFGISQGVEWTSFENLADSLASEKKPIIVKVETPWCKYCQLMDKKVYSKRKFAKEFGDNYYFVRLNAADKKLVVFNGKAYTFFWFNDKKGVNNLARELAEIEGVLRYPTTVVLNSDYTLNKRFVGYLDRLDLKYWLQTSDDDGL